jgi:hypothetical protein
MLYVFFWVIPRRLNFISKRFGTLCLLHHLKCNHLPVYEDGTECSEKSAHTIQTPGNYPEESIQQNTLFLQKPLRISGSYVMCYRYSTFSVSPRVSFRALGVTIEIVKIISILHKVLKICFSYNPYSALCLSL